MELTKEEKKAYIRDCLKQEREREAEKEENERKLQKEKEENERKDKLELEQQRLRMEFEEREKIRQHELELERIRSQSGTSVGNVSMRANVGSTLPKLPPFVDHKDDLDSFLTRFERFGETNGWPREDWPVHLSALLTGRALDCFCRLSTEEANNYESVKMALQRRYNLTEEGYRLKFRQCNPEDGESATMFIVRLRTYLERWVKLSQTEEEFDNLCDLLVREQFMYASPIDLAIHLREKGFKTADEVAKEADAFLTARNRKLKSKRPGQQNTVQEARGDSERSKYHDDSKINKDGHRTKGYSMGVTEI